MIRKTTASDKTSMSASFIRYKNSDYFAEVGIRITVLLFLYIHIPVRLLDDIF